MNGIDTRTGSSQAGVSLLTPQWSVDPGVTVCATTRLGGVSQPPFDTLNLGLHVGDDVDAVRENRRRLGDALALPAEPVWLNQTHGTDILRIGSENDSASGIACADGTWTEQPGTVLAVLTADCLPVVISTLDGRQLAVVHAGWRGLAAGILQQAIEPFDSDVELQAWLGPAIGPDAFEVGEEVRQAFVDSYPDHAESFLPGRGFETPSPDGRKRFWADIYGLAQRELQRCRPVSTCGGEYCTFSQPQWFHSHRRDGAGSGRMATLAWMDASRT